MPLHSTLGEVVMVIGGNTGSGGYTTDVEIVYFGGEKKACKKPADLPRATSHQTGANVNGVPTICGGYHKTERKGLFNLQKDH